MKAIGPIKADCGRNGPGRGKSMHKNSEVREEMARGTSKNIEM